MASQYSFGFSGDSVPQIRIPFSAEIEILSRSDGSPAVRVQGSEVGYRLSLSHRADLALAVATTGEVGCDLELEEPRSRGFVEDYFDERERALIESADRDHTPALVNSLWSAKESTLKLLRKGLIMDTRLVSIEPSESIVSETWKPFAATVSSESRPLAGWWRARGRHLLSVGTDPASSMPRHLDRVHPGEG